MDVLISLAALFALFAGTFALIRLTSWLTSYEDRKLKARAFGFLSWKPADLVALRQSTQHALHSGKGVSEHGNTLRAINMAIEKMPEAQQLLLAQRERQERDSKSMSGELTEFIGSVECLLSEYIAAVDKIEVEAARHSHWPSCLASTIADTLASLTGSKHEIANEIAEIREGWRDLSSLAIGERATRIAQWIDDDLQLVNSLAQKLRDTPSESPAGHAYLLIAGSVVPILDTSKSVKRALSLLRGW